MTKREFLKQLRSCLSQLNGADRDQVLLYWSEAIDDRLEAGMTEEQIFAELESPDIIALRILSELHSAANQPAPPPVQPQAEPVRSDARRQELEARRDEIEAQIDEIEAQIEAQIEAELEAELEAQESALEAELEALEAELDALEDELDELDDVHEGFSFNIKIPEIHIPEINIPEIKLPNFEGKEWSFNFRRRGEEDSKLRRRHLDANPATVRELRVIDHNNGIQLEPSEDDRIHIRWTENANHKYEVTGEQGVLTLAHQQPDFLERMFGASRREKVVVQLPSGFGGYVNMKTSNSSIKADTLHLCGKVELTTSNSKIEVETLVAGQLICATSNSKLTCDTVQAETIDLRTSNSTLAVNSTQAKTLQARTSNGSLKAECVDALNVTLQTSNGSISGELVGRAEDYTVVESHTSNGSNRNPARPGGERQLHLRTSNGSIKVEFMG